MEYNYVDFMGLCIKSNCFSCADPEPHFTLLLTRAKDMWLCVMSIVLGSLLA